MRFGAQLRRARVDAGMTGPELAARTGWSRTQIFRIEASANVTERTVRRYLAGIDGSMRRLFVLPAAHAQRN